MGHSAATRSATGICSSAMAASWLCISRLRWPWRRWVESTATAVIPAAGTLPPGTRRSVGKWRASPTSWPRAGEGAVARSASISSAQASLHLVGDRAEHPVVDDPRRLGALVVAEDAHGGLGHAGTVGDRRRTGGGFQPGRARSQPVEQALDHGVGFGAGHLRVVGLGDVRAGLGQRTGHDVGEGHEGLPLDRRRAAWPAGRHRGRRPPRSGRRGRGGWWRRAPTGRR